MNKRALKRLLQASVLAFLGITLCGCGISPKPDFYLLHQAASSRLTGLERGIAIGIGPVNVAPYLDRPQIVTRTGNHRLQMSEFHRWSEPLKSGISTVLAINLSNKLQSNRVYLLPRQNRTIPLDYRIIIDIVRFDGQLAGTAQLAARWTLYGKDEQAILTKVSLISADVQGKTYEQLVAAENRTLQKLSAEIAAAITARQMIDGS